MIFYYCLKLIDYIENNKCCPDICEFIIIISFIPIHFIALLLDIVLFPIESIISLIIFIISKKRIYTFYKYKGSEVNDNSKSR